MAKKKAVKKKRAPSKPKKKPRSPKPEINGTKIESAIDDDMESPADENDSDEAGDGQLTLPFNTKSTKPIVKVTILRKARHENASGAV